VTRIEPPPLELPDPSDLQPAPQLAVVTALDATLSATIAALEARHRELDLRCWTPNADEDIRLAAAVVAAASALRLLLAEYDTATHIRNFNEIPF
jgi:hypothetical protein